ncbi:hypothetical protein L3X38_029560 [Prunus dulcis]|uniref:Uncharacterized protein n=1 Tax=Prunus dulcis TaxID=3755 RepID=A0AAD4VTU1_PRUDU|nr:hypothetical protein L3X38_029560 [Prunus dulcis]
MVFLSWQARDQLVPLASITSSSILRGVFAHGRPEIAYAKSLLSKRPASSVISTFAVVYFAENLERLWVVNDGFLPARILVDLHQVRLFCLFYARLVKLLDRDGASELGIQC